MITYDQIVELAKTILQAPVLLAVAGTLISLFTSYWPGFSEWYAKLTTAQKQLGQLFAVTFIVLVVAVLNYTLVLVILPDGTPGVLILVFSWFSALKANQTAFELSPVKPSVQKVLKTLKTKGV